MKIKMLKKVVNQAIRTVVHDQAREGLKLFLESMEDFNDDDTAIDLDMVLAVLADDVARAAGAKDEEE